MGLLELEIDYGIMNLSYILVNNKETKVNRSKQPRKSKNHAEKFWSGHNQGCRCKEKDEMKITIFPFINNKRKNTQKNALTGLQTRVQSRIVAR